LNFKVIPETMAVKI